MKGTDGMSMDRCGPEEGRKGKEKKEKERERKEKNRRTDGRKKVRERSEVVMMCKGVIRELPVKPVLLRDCDLF